MLTQNVSKISGSECAPDRCASEARKLLTLLMGDAEIHSECRSQAIFAPIQIHVDKQVVDDPPDLHLPLPNPVKPIDPSTLCIYLLIAQIILHFIGIHNAAEDK